MTFIRLYFFCINGLQCHLVGGTVILHSVLVDVSTGELVKKDIMSLMNVQLSIYVIAP